MYQLFGFRRHLPTKPFQNNLLAADKLKENVLIKKPNALTAITR
jgi:hypothetical protein